jgi:hypothetical protein
MKKLYYILVSIILAYSSLFGQSNVKRIIIDQNNSSVPGVHIEIDGTDFRDVTDINGEFILYNIPIGSYFLLES